ncbi:class I glutamine amidotransferase-like protein [Setomelanomma holmii]|uniref:Class I glutamine amidotransferase-like protein n=1 Tax=Setomelanomma holmii TaxID=210430 RepID=A0A9P4LGW2_9PLEO|nr:class I glutamine amidotransferase-like protein [Setomelanomma holmii]
MAQTLRICMLNADAPVPAIVDQRAPTYGRIFHNLLSAAASQIAPDVKVTSTDFDVVNGQYPTSLADFDAIIISGSANSAYDDLDWIRGLDAYTLDVYQNEPRVKIFGSCFGHQLMCQSLLGARAVRVEQDPKGWEIGVQDIILHDHFRSALRANTLGILGDIPESIRLQFVHHDHVVLPTPDSLPLDWMPLGSTQHCAVQGIYKPGRILTLQGHFEFDRFVNGETVRYFFPKLAPQALSQHLDAIDADDDAVGAAMMVLGFLLEKGSGQAGATRAVVGGLLTPPLVE